VRIGKFSVLGCFVGDLTSTVLVFFGGFGFVSPAAFSRSVGIFSCILSFFREERLSELVDSNRIVVILSVLPKRVVLELFGLDLFFWSREIWSDYFLS
jgi:hypothetical protein